MESPVVVRIYIVQATNLRPRDKHDLSDAYLKIEYGESKVFVFLINLILLNEMIIIY